MKYVLLLAGIAIIYFVLIRKAPVVPVVQAVTAQEAAPLLTGPRNPSPAPATTSLKRPIDRTQAVLDQARQRNGSGEF